MLARVAEHGHAQVVMHPQQQVGEHPPAKNVKGVYKWRCNETEDTANATSQNSASLNSVFLDRARG
jgi:hypothetical protein